MNIFKVRRMLFSLGVDNLRAILSFQTSTTINPTLKPMVAHLMGLWIALITFHLIDRQTEYISRIDYGWKQELLKEQVSFS